MKKLILSLTICLGAYLSMNAQVNPHAIGLRFGGNNLGNGVEISYQHGFGDANRLELGLGFANHSIYSRTGISAIYQWVWNIESGFNWYAGPGAQIWSYSYRGYYYNNNNVLTKRENSIGLTIGGQIGIEYNFNKKGTPLILSLDTRPMFNFNSYNQGFGYGLALALRYTF